MVMLLPKLTFMSRLQSVVSIFSMMVVVMMMLLMLLLAAASSAAVVAAGDELCSFVDAGYETCLHLLVNTVRQFRVVIGSVRVVVVVAVGAVSEVEHVAGTSDRHTGLPSSGLKARHEKCAA